MEWILLIIVIALAVKMFLPTKGVSNITVNEAKDKTKENDVQFVDVRTPGEYKANHRKEFKNIPLAKLPNRTSELDPNKEVVVICQSGMRSSKLLRC